MFEATHPAVAAVTDDYASLRSDIANLADSVKRLASFEGVQESLEVAVRRKPFQSTAIAAVLGFVLALIIAR